MYAVTLGQLWGSLCRVHSDSEAAAGQPWAWCRLLAPQSRPATCCPASASQGSLSPSPPPRYEWTAPAPCTRGGGSGPSRRAGGGLGTPQPVGGRGRPPRAIGQRQGACPPVAPPLGGSAAVRPRGGASAAGTAHGGCGGGGRAARGGTNHSLLRGRARGSPGGSKAPKWRRGPAAGRDPGFDGGRDLGGPCPGPAVPGAPSPGGAKPRCPGLRAEGSVVAQCRRKAAAVGELPRPSAAGASHPVHPLGSVRKCRKHKEMQEIQGNAQTHVSISPFSSLPRGEELPCRR